ncbi:hypothetical protein PMW_56 [Pseudomonas phage phiPMW]|uniref:Uncharacterized protein n=1 Tax=Pseudomonas phage phiPMW TaxID=1815582 RepID=A0A1S5R190_9CAUD|nr:hypothetical protein FDG97_gp056 [Pseudomonas phage phiPMW]ANA49181.1 hypothetical protein PMW_56 [Pseudomonas phage phiPMW]
MNVMAKAHKAAKTAKALGSTIAYRELFRVALKQAHKEYKAMQIDPMEALKLDTIAKFEKRLNELSELLKVKGVEDQYIVTVENMAVDFNAKARMPFSGIEGATKFDSKEHAELEAKRLKNGNKVGGVAVRLDHQIEFEMQKLCQLINEIKSN